MKLLPGMLIAWDGESTRKVYLVTRPHATLADHFYARKWSHVGRHWTDEARYGDSCPWMSAPEEWPQVIAIRRTEAAYIARLRATHAALWAQSRGEK